MNKSSDASSATLGGRMERLVIGVSGIIVGIATLLLLSGTAHAQSLTDLGGLTPGEGSEAQITLQAPVEADTTAPTETTNESQPLLNGETNINENLISEEPPNLLGGSAESVNEVSAPIIPAQATVGVEGNALIEDAVGQDVCLQAGVNAPPAECAPSQSPTQPPSESPGNDLGSAPVSVDNDTSTNVDVDNILDGGNNESAPLESIVESGTSVDAPLPVETAATADADALVRDLALADACAGVGVNQDPSNCPPANEDAPPENSLPINGDVDADADLGLPLPTEGAADAETDAALEDLAEAGVCLDVEINRSDTNCVDPDENETPPGEDTEPGEEIPGGNLPIVGDIDAEVGVDAPILPVEGEVGSETAAAIEDILDLGLCVGAGVNRDAPSCADPNDPGSPDPETPGPENPGPENPENPGPENPTPESPNPESPGDPGGEGSSGDLLDRFGGEDFTFIGDTGDSGNAPGASDAISSDGALSTLTGAESVFLDDVGVLNAAPVSGSGSVTDQSSNSSPVTASSTEESEDTGSGATDTASTIGASTLPDTGGPSPVLQVLGALMLALGISTFLLARRFKGGLL